MICSFCMSGFWEYWYADFPLLMYRIQVRPCWFVITYYRIRSYQVLIVMGPCVKSQEPSQHIDLLRQIWIDPRALNVRKGNEGMHMASFKGFTVLIVVHVISLQCQDVEWNPLGLQMYAIEFYALVLCKKSAWGAECVINVWISLLTLVPPSAELHRLRHRRSLFFHRWIPALRSIQHCQVQDFCDNKLAQRAGTHSAVHQPRDVANGVPQWHWDMWFPPNIKVWDVANVLTWQDTGYRAEGLYLHQYSSIPLHSWV